MQKRNENSALRKKYILRLIARCAIFIAAVALFIFIRDEFEILEGFNFFTRFSIFHLLWIVWVADMIFQLVPVKNKIPIGSQKHLKYHFKHAKERINKDALKKYIVDTTKSAYKVMILWCTLIAALGIFYFTKLIKADHLLMISIFFYVADLICVLVWCPFRLMMGTRCCTTCRIFNWDHFMMFSPLMFVGGFFSISLFVMSVIVLAFWEFCVFVYPERFWEGSNTALKCSECTDKLCTQYCKKIRRKPLPEFDFKEDEK